jgi:hypothetical protein
MAHSCDREAVCGSQDAGQTPLLPKASSASNAGSVIFWGGSGGHAPGDARAQRCITACAPPQLWETWRSHAQAFSRNELLPCSGPFPRLGERAT